MIGLALEGGGTRGAYHVGAMKALVEEGIEIGFVAGTSIGAFNAAMFAQGDLKKLEELYSGIRPRMLLDINETLEKYLIDEDIKANSIFEVIQSITAVIRAGGFEIGPLFKLVEEYIDEPRLRESAMRFGLATYNLTQRKTVDITKEKIPENELVNYIVASCYLPGFKGKINGTKYIDGGIYNNIPINILLEDDQVDEIYVIRTNAVGVVDRHLSQKKVPMHVIAPKEDMGGILYFNPKMIEHNMDLGYFDTKKYLHHLWGDHFYLSSVDEERLCLQLINLSKNKIERILKVLGFEEKNIRRAYFEEALPLLFAGCKKDKNSSYAELAVCLLENVAVRCEMDRFKIYQLDEFIDEMHSKIRNLKPLSITPLQRFGMNISKKGMLSSEQNPFLQECARIVWEEE